MRCVIGVDPGASGGIACLSRGGAVEAHKMPTTDDDLWALVESLCLFDGVTAYIENVHSMPGQGVASSFKFGANFGLCRMALTAAGARRIYVSPVKWQRDLGVLKKKGMTKVQHKNQLKARAQELFPGIDRITLATADALLIAEYGRVTES